SPKAADTPTRRTTITARRSRRWKRSSACRRSAARRRRGRTISPISSSPARYPERLTSLVRPLLTRPGPRFACFGDGVCCTDLHLLGPLTRREVLRLRVLSPDVAVHNAQLDAVVLRVTPRGECVFFDQGCALHRALGPMGKPGGCRRFPFRLV